MNQELRRIIGIFASVKAENSELKAKNEELTEKLGEVTMLALRLRRMLEEERKIIKRR